ncbi:putative domain HDIG-containing protein [Desulfosporosinus orientis DSM 765]|uniref:Putative domain HDIG-containing protein n=1 Tax=Desulfosporosinus orientis (strain ATCC 19365 / DSM 765 / NCIMB 8382 / VKM B-1628 / Singapore I) TaxID=768706 RepID=G7W9S3_DESOD|nr:HD domain-containing phosphohydrolase [Desulfosporosinus orientis]AET70639.1 putative domain HDIG-containing protein [Desulfosporosinus orientis DSM 765]
MVEDAFYIRRMWSFSHALDLGLVDEEVERDLQISVGERHGERVAYIAMRLGRSLGLNKKALVHLTVAGLLHDIGALGFFREYEGDRRLLQRHCFVGASIVQRFPAGDILAQAIKYHHETPDPAHGALHASEAEVPLMARILSFADQVDLLIKRRLTSRKDREEIIDWVSSNTGTLFYSEVAAAFKQVAQKEAFWLDLDQPDLLQIALELLCGKWHLPSTRDLKSGFTDDLAATFADLIDQKSKFTARHSRSVAETVQHLAEGLGWQDERLHEIYTAGLLHDLGKLSIPRKILDKPGPLDSMEIKIIRTHTYYTHRLLTQAGFPTRMVEWAAHHHERLDGKGYPFALGENELDEGSRVMAIADIFAALTEDRPYRKAMSQGEALALIQRGAGTMLDPGLIDVAKRVL